MFVDGAFVPSTGRESRAIVDPATRDVVAQVPDATPDDVEHAVAAARRAFDDSDWPRTPAVERGRILLKLATIVRERADELASLETRNTGKPIVEAEYDISDVAACFEYYGGLATKIHGEVVPVPDGALALALREPIGVAAQIIPWNYPLLMAAWKLAPAICAGCTVDSQTGRGNAAHGARPRRELRRGRSSRRRGEHRDGRRIAGRRASGCPS